VSSSEKNNPNEVYEITSTLKTSFSISGLASSSARGVWLTELALTTRWFVELPLWSSPCSQLLSVGSQAH